MKLTLSKSWELCVDGQWKWIVKQIRAGARDVWGLKRQWLRENGIDSSEVSNHCFFCEYTSNFKHDDCRLCPGCKIDKSFSCMDKKYNFEKKPLKFYAKLRALNKIRLEKKGQKNETNTKQILGIVFEAMGARNKAIKER